MLAPNPRRRLNRPMAINLSRGIPLEAYRDLFRCETMSEALLMTPAIMASIRSNHIRNVAEIWAYKYSAQSRENGGGKMRNGDMEAAMACVPYRRLEARPTIIYNARNASARRGLNLAAWRR